MKLNFKNIGHTTALILVITGLLITGIGAALAEVNYSTLQSGTARDETGILELIFMIIGALIALAGGLFTVITLISWVFGTLVQHFGFKAVFMVVGTICLGVYIYSKFIHTDSLGDPIPVGIRDGTVYRGPTFNEVVLTVLDPATSLKLLNVTDSITDGYPWFKVAYNDSLNGFMWGRNLCAQDVWVNGLWGRCLSHQNQQSLTFLRVNANDSLDKPIDNIETAYKMLPGYWREPSYSHEFNQQREIVYDDNIIGRWTLETDDDNNFLVLINLEYYGKLAHMSYKYKITQLDSTFLGLKLGFDSTRYTRITD